jgi:GNAT superfamily N-acetyltransferase
MDDIRLLETDQELRSSYPVMRQLRPHLSEEEYLRRLAQQRAHELYHVVAAFEDGTVRALGGFRLQTALAHGKFVYVDDLVTDENARSSGHGARLLAWIGEFGKARGCTNLQLDSGVQRHGAHRFYLRERMDIVCYHFRKDIP